MPHPYPVDSSFSAGMKRDFDRSELPPGSAWNLVDLIPDQLGCALRGRGGWAYGDSGAMTSVTSVVALAHAPFAAGAKTLAIGQNSELWRIDTGPTDIGAAITPAQNPIYYRGKVIIPNNDGTTAPKYYDGTTLGALAGSPPTCMYATSFADHAVLARTSANDYRIFFSAAGDPTSWNTSSGYVDADGGTLTSVVGLRSMVLAFHADSVDRFRGSVPPPNTDFAQDKQIFNVGCLDAFSVQRWNDNVIFAGARGIYATDGSGLTDLTARAGMSTYYQTQMGSYTTSWRLGSFIYRNHYILTLNNGSSAVDTFVINLLTGSMWRFSNFHVNCGITVATGGVEEGYFGLANAGRVGKASTCWAPVAAVKNDADGTTPRFTLETKAYRGFDRLHRRWIPSMGLQRWKYVYLSYNLTDYASDTPSLSWGWANTPDASGYRFALTGFAAGNATTRKRNPIPTSNKSNWLALEIANGTISFAPGDLRIYAVELVYDPVDVGRLA